MANRNQAVENHPIQKSRNFLLRAQTWWNPIAWAFYTVIGIVTSVALTTWLILEPRVDATVAKDLSSPEIVGKLSTLLSPCYAVIDAKRNSPSAVFLNDHGVGDLVDSIELQDAQPNFSAILTLHLKKFVRLPRVEPTTSGIYINSYWQTNKYDWAFEIRVSPTASKTPNGMTTFQVAQNLPDDCNFYIEIMPD